MADILIIDDDANLRMALEMTLQGEGHTCRVADRAEAGWLECQRRVPDLALLDLQLPDGDGLDLLARMRERQLEMPVVVMTAFGTVTNAVKAMKRGAADFIEKPMSVKDVCQLVLRLLKSRELAQQLDGPPHPKPGDAEGVRIVGNSAAMRQVLELAVKIAAMPLNSGMGLISTLITGETGTGKELIARYIHQASSRPDSAFVQVNCSAIPETLFETEHFGHERGVFTDAKTAKQGLFEAAHEGTLFLDEVGDMPLAMQAKLLVAIETGRFRRVGSVAEQRVSLRVLAATNCNLESKVKAGTFRADLYHRFKMFCVRLPALRDRDGDLMLLCDHFLDHFSQRLGKPRPTLNAGAREALLTYAWPGNIRELGHVLLRVIATCDSTVLDATMLGLSPISDDESVPTTAASPDLAESVSGDLTLAAVEEKLIQTAMARANGSITEAARLLGVTRGTLRYRLEKMGLI